MDGQGQDVNCCIWEADSWVPIYAALNIATTTWTVFLMVRLLGNKSEHPIAVTKQFAREGLHVHDGRLRWYSSPYVKPPFTDHGLVHMDVLSLAKMYGWLVQGSRRASAAASNAILACPSSIHSQK